MHFTLSSYSVLFATFMPHSVCFLRFPYQWMQTKVHQKQ
jgi:hypothetical protein